MSNRYIENDVRKLIRCGETTTVQFKEIFSGRKKIAEELVAFSNSRGGDLLFGVRDKTGEVVGLSYEEVQEVSRELGNTANEQVRPTIYVSTDVVELDDKLVLVCHVDEGRNKPYKTLDGTIWVKQGADKRRVTENSEILSLFQESGTYNPDIALMPGTTMRDLDMMALDDYFRQVYHNSMDHFGTDREKILRNIHILAFDSTLTLAGYLFFGKRPQEHCPTFMIKAVAFYGNSLGGNNFRDSKDFYGSIPRLYEQGMSFMKANLHSRQMEKSFNKPGRLEIAEEALEEILQNALVHRDYLRPAPIRILIFDNRLEIVSPGSLGGGLTEEDIRMGDTYQRNPNLAVFCNNVLSYRGLGSGMLRIYGACPNVEMRNEDSGKQFVVIIPRDPSWAEVNDDNVIAGSLASVSSLDVPDNRQDVPVSSLDVPDDHQDVPNNSLDVPDIKNEDRLSLIIKMLKTNGRTSATIIAETLGVSTKTIKRDFAILKQKKLVERVGGEKTGYWKVVE